MCTAGERDRVCVGKRERERVSAAHLVCAQDGRNLFLRAVKGDELGARGDVDPVDVGIAHRRRSRGEVNLFCASFPGQLHEFHTGSASHDTVVDEEHHLVLELRLDCVELQTDSLATHFLPGHDERSCDVAILDEAFSVRPLEDGRAAQGTRTRRLGNRHDDVNVMCRVCGQDLLGQLGAHTRAGFIHLHSIHHAVRPREVDELEEAWRELRARVDNLRREFSAHGDENSLACSNVALEYEERVEGVDGDTLAGDGVVSAEGCFAAAKAERPDAERVTKSKQADAIDEHDDCITSLAAPHDTSYSIKELVCCQLLDPSSLQLFCKDIQKQLAVAICIDVAMLLAH